MLSTTCGKYRRLHTCVTYMYNEEVVSYSMVYSAVLPGLYVLCKHGYRRGNERGNGTRVNESTLRSYTGLFTYVVQVYVTDENSEMGMVNKVGPRYGTGSGRIRNTRRNPDGNSDYLYSVCRI